MTHNSHQILSAFYRAGLNKKPTWETDKTCVAAVLRACSKLSSEEMIKIAEELEGLDKRL